MVFSSLTDMSFQSWQSRPLQSVASHGNVIVCIWNLLPVMATLFFVIGICCQSWQRYCLYLKSVASHGNVILCYWNLLPVMVTLPLFEICCQSWQHYSLLLESVASHGNVILCYWNLLPVMVTLFSVIGICCQSW